MSVCDLCGKKLKNVTKINLNDTKMIKSYMIVFVNTLYMKSLSGQHRFSPDGVF